MNRDDAVVITGLGLITPAGVGVGPYLRALRQGLVCISELSDKGLSRSRASIAGQVPIQTPPGEVRLHQFAALCLSEALSQSGLDLHSRRVGLVMGTAIATTREMELAYQNSTPIKGRLVRFGTFTDEWATLNGLSGPTYTVSTGCAAGLDALGIGLDQIRLGRSDVMLVVAADSTISPIVFAAFDQIGALSKRNMLHGSSQPFGAHRDGFVLSEAGAAVVLESRSSALERGAVPIAELVACESVSSGYHMTSMRTNGDDLVRLLQSLFNRSSVGVDAVDLIDVHGTSTQINDLSEANALRRLFGSRLTEIYVSAQKAHIGHSLGASNLVEIVGVARMLCDSFVPGAPLYREVDPKLNVRLPRETLDNVDLRIAAKISSSFSGIHSAALLRAYR